MTNTILVVDDQSSVRQLLQEYLTEQGFRVILADNGQNALYTARRDQPDLILLDIQLPVMDGYAVARHLRANAALAAIPVVAVTSHAMVGDRDKAMAAGCNGYIEKPINPETFLSEVEMHLRPS